MPQIHALVLPMFVIAIPAAASPIPDLPCETVWARQFGTAGYDRAEALGLDAKGHTYVTGLTRGDIGGPNAGFDDAFLVNFDPAGQVVWARQLGTDDYEYTSGVGIDARGNVYIAGGTLGDLDGLNAGGIDGYIAKFNSNGDLEWIHQFGTVAHERVLGAAVDGAGNILIAGGTEGSVFGPLVGQTDVFVVKFNADGEQVWGRQLGTPNFEQPRSLVVADDGNVYIAGYTYGSFGGPSTGMQDAFLLKLDSDGGTAWNRQFGSSANDEGVNVAMDPFGNIFVTGATEGNLAVPNLGNSDVFLAKYSPDGNALWIRQTGTPFGDLSNAVASDSAGNAYIVGSTDGHFAASQAGLADIMIAKYDSSGALRWTRQAGTAVNEYGNGIAVDVQGNITLVGESTGAFAGTYLGSFDPVLLRLMPPCTGDIPPTAPGSCGDRTVDINDLLAVVGSWGACVGCPATPCAADINRDCTINIDDLLTVVGSWGACP